MKTKISYTEAPKDVSRTITEGEMITDFFKKHAQKNKVKYQTMINEVLDKYVQRYKEKAIV